MALNIVHIGIDPMLKRYIIVLEVLRSVELVLIWPFVLLIVLVLVVL